MKNINCYGNENKVKLVEKFYIKPIMYLGLLKNQEKQGCCGKLTDRYYIFKATDKISKKEVSFYAGKHCAEGILNLIKVKPLPFSNPLKSINDENTKKGNSSNNNIGSKKKKVLHPLNQKLIQAIQIISMAWDYPPPVSVLNIIDFTLNKLDEFRINKRGIEWVNQNLLNDEQGRTLSQIYSDLKGENPNLKEIDFEILKNYMNEKHPEEVNRY